MRRLLLAVAMLAGLGGSPGHAQRSYAEDCVDLKLKPEAQVKACTTWIDKSWFSASRAKGYYNRAVAYRLMKDFDRALADYDRAIKLSPDAVSYTARGLTRLMKRDRAGAEADFRTALTLPATGDNGGWAHDRARVQLALLLPGDKIFQAQAAEVAASKARSDDQKREVELLRKEREDTKARLAREEEKRQAAENKLVAAFAAQTKAAAAAQPASQPKAAPHQVRVALVIGNSKYAHIQTLTNPRNDAAAVAAAFRKLGFTHVAEEHNLNRGQMVDALLAFEAKARAADWAVVYYAGHGVRPRASLDDYLIPVDAKLEHEKDLPLYAVALEHVLHRIERARQLQLVLFDACRDNPLTRRLSAELSAQRNVPPPAAGSIESARLVQAFSAWRGSTAADGGGANSPFTEALVAHLSEDNLDVTGLLRRVSDTVAKKTSSRQVPQFHGLEWGRGQVVKPVAAR